MPNQISYNQYIDNLCLLNGFPCEQIGGKSLYMREEFLLQTGKYGYGRFDLEDKYNLFVFDKKTKEEKYFDDLVNCVEELMSASGYDKYSAVDLKFWQLGRDCKKITPYLKAKVLLEKIAQEG